MRSLLALVWFALAAWFWLGADVSRADVLGDVPRTPAVAPSDIDRDAARELLPVPPRVKIGGVMQKCSDCHALFPSHEKTPGDVRQHGHLVHDHGMNDACFNCHSRGDRNLLVLNDGTELALADSSRLCAQCHGTLYRDWDVGVHGKTRGSWITGSEEQERMQCIECHEPHAPAFEPFAPLPGPNTWRMGPVGGHHEGEATHRNPLERWKHLGERSGAEDHE